MTVIPFPRRRRHPMDRDQMRAAVAQSLLVDDSRETNRNVYVLRARRQEREARAMLAPRSGNVTNLGPSRPPEPPRPAA